MAIFKKKMSSVGPKSPEDQRDKPKAQVIMRPLREITTNTPISSLPASFA